MLVVAAPDAPAAGAVALPDVPVVVLGVAVLGDVELGEVDPPLLVPAPAPIPSAPAAPWLDVPLWAPAEPLVLPDVEVPAAIAAPVNDAASANAAPAMS